MPTKGRSTDNPKNTMFRVRLSDEDVRRLDYCAEKTGMTKSEIVRKGIEEAYQRAKKQ